MLFGLNSQVFTMIREACSAHISSVSKQQTTIKTELQHCIQLEDMKTLPGLFHTIPCQYFIDKHRSVGVLLMAVLLMAVEDYSYE